MTDDLVLDPTKDYAEIGVGTNIVVRVFRGEVIPGWSIVPGRFFIEVPANVVVVPGMRYNAGVFDTPPPPLTRDQLAERAVDNPQLRVLFEVNFDQELRLRALEGKPAITKIQYRNALIEEWKKWN